MPTPAELLPSTASKEETKKAISDTIRMLTKEKVGKTPEQRVAIAYSQARGSTGKTMSPQKGAGKSLKKEGKNMPNGNIKRGATKLPARGPALPVEQLTPESADKEIQIALVLSVALLQRQGMSEEEAKEIAYRSAEQAIGHALQGFTMPIIGPLAEDIAKFGAPFPAPLMGPSAMAARAEPFIGTAGDISAMVTPWAQLGASTLMGLLETTPGLIDALGGIISGEWMSRK